MELKVIGKKLNTGKIKNLLTQDEKGIDTINIVLPKIYGEIDLSAFTFKMRGASEKNTLTEQILSKTVVGEDLNLLWTVTSDFTAVSGVLALEIVGVDSNNTEIIKITADDIFVKSGVLGTYNPPTDILEDALAQMQTAVATCQALADGLVIDNNLTSTSSTHGLASVQGKILNDKVTNIGGTNLVKNSAWLVDTAEWYSYGTNGFARDTATTFKNCVSVKISRTGLVSDSTALVSNNIASNRVSCSIGDVFTYSFYIKTDNYSLIDGTSPQIIIEERDVNGAFLTQGINTLSLTVNNKWVKCSLTYTVANANVNSVNGRLNVNRNGTLWKVCPNLERGYVATDWSPSPQDIQNRLSSFGGVNLLTNSTWSADAVGWGLSTGYAALDASVKFNGYNSVKVATSGQTSDKFYSATSPHRAVIAGETYIASVWAMTDDITSIDSSGARLYIYGYNQSVVRQSLNAAYGDVYVPITFTQNNKWVRVSVLIQPTAADVGEVAVVPMLTRNGRVWFSQPQLERGSVATDYSPSPNDIPSSLIGLGGTNLNQNAAWLTDTVGYSITAAGWVRDATTKMGNCIASKVSRTGLVTTTSVYITGALPTNIIPCKVGDVFTVSVYLMTTDYASVDDVLRVGFDQLDAANAYMRSTDIKPSLTENNVWRRYTHTVTITDATVKSVRSLVGIYKNGTVWMAGIKVERGYIATDWSPNPQDLRDASCQLLLGTFATRPTTVAQKSMYLATDKVQGDVNRLTLSTDGVTWYQI